MRRTSGARSRPAAIDPTACTPRRTPTSASLAPRSRTTKSTNRTTNAPCASAASATTTSVRRSTGLRPTTARPSTHSRPARARMRRRAGRRGRRAGAADREQRRDPGERRRIGEHDAVDAAQPEDDAAERPADQARDAREHRQRLVDAQEVGGRDEAGHRRAPAGLEDRGEQRLDDHDGVDDPEVVRRAHPQERQDRHRLQRRDRPHQPPRLAAVDEDAGERRGEDHRHELEGEDRRGDERRPGQRQDEQRQRDEQHPVADLGEEAGGAEAGDARAAEGRGERHVASSPAWRSGLRNARRVTWTIPASSGASIADRPHVRTDQRVDPPEECLELVGGHAQRVAVVARGVRPRVGKVVLAREVAAVEVVGVRGGHAGERGASDRGGRAVVGRVGEHEADGGRPPRARPPVPVRRARRALDEADLLERPQVPRAVRRGLPHDRRALARRARPGGEEVVEQREARRDGQRGEGLGTDDGAGRERVGPGGVVGRGISAPRADVKRRLHECDGGASAPRCQAVASDLERWVARRSVSLGDAGVGEPTQ